MHDFRHHLPAASSLLSLYGLMFWATPFAAKSRSVSSCSIALSFVSQAVRHVVIRTVHNLGHWTGEARARCMTTKRLCPSCQARSSFEGKLRLMYNSSICLKTPIVFWIHFSDLIITYRIDHYLTTSNKSPPSPSQNSSQCPPLCAPPPSSAPRRASRSPAASTVPLSASLARSLTSVCNPNDRIPSNLRVGQDELSPSASGPNKERWLT